MNALAEKQQKERAIDRVLNCYSDDAHCVGRELLKEIRRLRRRVRDLEDNKGDNGCQAYSLAQYQAYLHKKVTYQKTSAGVHKVASIMYRNKLSMIEGDDFVIHFANHFDSNRSGVLVLNPNGEGSEILSYLQAKGFWPLCN